MSGSGAWASGWAPGWYEVPGGWCYFDGYSFSTDVVAAPVAPVAARGGQVGDGPAGTRELAGAGGPAGGSANGTVSEGPGRWARRTLVALGWVVIAALVVFNVVMVTVRPGYLIGPEQAWRTCVDHVEASGSMAAGERWPGYNDLDVLVWPVSDRADRWRVRTYLQGESGRRPVMCVVETVGRAGQVVDWSVGD